MRWMVLISGLFLSGCMVHYSGAHNQGPPPLRSTTMAQVNSMAGVQQPVAYKVGFMEGCDSGRLSAGDNSYLFKKDVDRFNTDDVYQQGWNDGYNRCFSGEGSPPATYQSTNTYFGFGYYPYYYPGYYGYYPYYGSSYSVWRGNYGYRYPRYRTHYYTSPWYGGHKHRHGGKHFSGRRHSGGSGGSWLRMPGGKGHKGSSGKSGRGKGRGHKGGGSWLR